MLKNAKPWEQIQFAASPESTGQPSHLFRLQVPHGWLVAVGSGATAGLLTYVPDGAHIWDPGQGPPTA